MLGICRVAFVEFTSPQAAAAVKAKVEAGSNQPMYMGKRHSVSYTNPNSNPFRTLPKEAPQRDRPRDFQAGRGTSGPDRGGHIGGGGPPPNVGGGPVVGAGAGMNMGGGFRGGRGGFAGRGGGNMGGAPFMGGRGGFGGPVGGPQGSPQPAFQPPMSAGFGGPSMPMQQFGGGNFQGGFQGRGGMMPMRGGPAMRGRGGMGPGGMMGGGGMGMGGMGMGGGNMEGGGFNPMGGMAGFGMGGMGGTSHLLPKFTPADTVKGIGPGGFPAPHFNPAFFPGGPQGGGGGVQGQWNDNPHPAKRPRPNE